MFGFGKKKVSANELALIFIKEGFDSFNNINNYIAGNIEGFFDKGNDTAIEFLDKNGINRKDRIQMCAVFVLVMSRVFLARKLEDHGDAYADADAIKADMGVQKQLREVLEKNDMALNIKLLTSELDIILANNYDFNSRRELYPSKDIYAEQGLYVQLSNYLLNNAISINSKACNICSEDKKSFQTSLFLAFERMEDITNMIFNKIKVV